MKLKYNIDGSTETIPLATRKKPGKRLAIHQDGQNYYAPVVESDDPKASKLPVGVDGEVFAVQAQEPPEISAVNVAPSSVAVMQGQSAAATVTALANDAVAGLSYGLSGAPTWITISDDLILIQPSDNDLGIANVQVIAQDTSSDAMSSAILRAEAKLRPIIESLAVIPPAVTVQQRQSVIATVSAAANEAVTGLSYSIDGAPSWVTLADDSIVVAPTDNDSGNAVMTVFAYDNNSSASAATTFNATAALRPIISSVSVSPSTATAEQGKTTDATISATYQGLKGLYYSLTGAPSWMRIVSGNRIRMTPSTLDTAAATVTVTAHDSGSTVTASCVFRANVLVVPTVTDIVMNPEEPEVTSIGVTDKTVYASLRATGNIADEDLLFSVVSGQRGTEKVSVHSIDGSGRYGRLSLKTGTRSPYHGRYDFTVSAYTEADGELMRKAFSWWIRKPVYITKFPSSLQAATVGADVINETFTAHYYSSLVSNYHQENTKPYIYGALPKNATVSIGADLTPLANNSAQSMYSGFRYSISYKPSEQKYSSAKSLFYVSRTPSDSLKFSILPACTLTGVESETIAPVYRKDYVTLVEG